MPGLPRNDQNKAWCTTAGVVRLNLQCRAMSHVSISADMGARAYIARMTTPCRTPLSMQTKSWLRVFDDSALNGAQVTFWKHASMAWCVLVMCALR